MGDNNTKDPYVKMDITNFGKGVLAELFAENHEKILRNIMDASTNASELRKLTIEVTYKPSKDRKNIHFNIAAKSKLAQLPAFEGYGFIVQEKGKLFTMQDNPEQQLLGLEDGTLAHPAVVAGGGK